MTKLQPLLVDLKSFHSIELEKVAGTVAIQKNTLKEQAVTIVKMLKQSQSSDKSISVNENELRVMQDSVRKLKDKLESDVAGNAEIEVLKNTFDKQLIRQ